MNNKDISILRRKAFLSIYYSAVGAIVCMVAFFIALPHTYKSDIIDSIIVISPLLAVYFVYRFCRIIFVIEDYKWYTNTYYKDSISMDLSNFFAIMDVAPHRYTIRRYDSDDIKGIYIKYTNSKYGVDECIRMSTYLDALALSIYALNKDKAIAEQTEREEQYKQLQKTQAFLDIVQKDIDDLAEQSNNELKEAGAVLDELQKTKPSKEPFCDIAYKPFLSILERDYNEEPIGTRIRIPVDGEWQSWGYYIDFEKTSSGWEFIAIFQDPLSCPKSPYRL